MNLDALVAPLRADVVSGAAVVSRTAAEVLRRAAVRAEADDVPGLRHQLGELAVRILDAQPSMAPLVSLLAGAFEALDDAPDLEDARRRVARAAEAFRTEMEGEADAAARHAAELLEPGATVLTMSDSSTVRATLRHAAAAGPLSVTCLEGRPLQEGRALARAVADAGATVTFAVDAAAEIHLSHSDAVLLGADSVGDRGAVNKIGSAGLIRGARARGIPVWIVTDRSKLLPPGFPQPVDDDRPSEEVWKGASGIRVWNRYFEVFSLDGVSLIITGDGPRSPDEIEAERSGLALPAELARWAARRSTRT